MCNQLAALLAEVVVASHALLTPLPPSIPCHPTLCLCRVHWLLAGRGSREPGL